MERKRVKVSLEIYKDQEQEFYSLLYTIKNGLRNDRWLKLYKMSTMEKEEVIDEAEELGNQEDQDEVQLQESSEEENFYETIINLHNINQQISHLELEYIGLLKYLLNMIHIPSIDGEKLVSRWNVAPIYRVIKDNGQNSIPIYYEEKKIDKNLDLEAQVELWKKRDQEYVINEEKKKLFDEAYEFFKGAQDLIPDLSDHRFGELINWVVFNGCYLKPKNIKTDNFFDASLEKTFVDKLPSALRQGAWADTFLFQFKRSENYFYNKFTKADAYLLIGKIYKEAKFNFPDLVQPEVRDYQLRIIAGYVGGLIGVFKDIETYILRHGGGGKSYRNYLADNVLNFLIKTEIYPPKNEKKI